MLEDWGHETLSAATGEVALDRAAQANWGAAAAMMSACNLRNSGVAFATMPAIPSPPPAAM
ncbi:hypothetical protein M2323_004495 [Rhodoblastus acidophilus]|nr:hypothetical protein [Rhodoblastus acidophilus]MCW2335546.1 hypothetical protein [Rhodoblastus acidophilus]